MFWFIWKMRNRACFDNVLPSNPSDIIYTICHLLDSWCELQKPRIQEELRQGNNLVKIMLRHIFTRARGWAPLCRRLANSSVSSGTVVCGWYVQNVSTFPNTFAIVSPLICMFWIQLTRTDVVFSRIALVSCFCAEIQLTVKIQEKSSKILFHQKTHGARRRDGEEARGALTHRWCGPALAAPPWREEAPAALSTSPLAYIYPLT
jgi:hypothetical protein